MMPDALPLGLTTGPATHVITSQQLFGPSRVTDRSLLPRIFEFRARVWSETLGRGASPFPAGSWQDAYDDTAEHWIVRDMAARIVAAARCSVHERLEELDEAEVYLPWDLGPGPYAAPARVVVCPRYQGRGLAWKLLMEQDAFAEQQGARLGLRQASPGMVRLLLQRHWRVLGPGPADERFPGVEFQIAVRDYSN